MAISQTVDRSQADLSGVVSWGGGLASGWDGSVPRLDP